MSDVAESERRERTSWHGKAFLIEAMLLLAILVASLGVLMTLFVNARVESAQGERLTQAVQLAKNAAEQFAADPLGASDLVLRSDGLTATVQVTEEAHERGVLARALVTVTDEDPVRAADEGAPSYELATARYIPADQAEGDDGSEAR